MKDKILIFLKGHQKQQFNARQIAHHLTLPEGEFWALKNELKDLVRQGKVIIHPESRYSFRDEKKVLKGTIGLHPQGYGFFVPEEKGKADVFIPNRYINHAMNGDVVLVESSVNDKDGRYEGRVVQVVKRVNTHVVGKLFKSAKHYYVEPMDLGGCLEIYIPQKKLMRAAEGELVLVRMLQYPGYGIEAIGEIEKVFGEESSDVSLTEAVLQKHGIRREFNSAVTEELNRISNEVELNGSERRIDLRELPIITIDGVNARDFDDAVCVLKKGKTIILYVSIADVSEYVRKGSAIDQEAYKRGTSTYLSDRCIPMLPEKLSNNLCSLVPHQPRLTLTAEIHFNEAYQFTKALCYRSIIQSHKRATYQEIQACFDGTGDQQWDPAVKKSLQLMKGLAEHLMVQAGQRGALDFDLPESEVIYDPQGNIRTIQRVQRFFSHRLIEVFMIMANQVVAQFFTTRCYPQLYRVHDQPDSFKMANFVEMLESFGIKGKRHQRPDEYFKAIVDHPMESFFKVVFLRSLKQARYSPENRGHYGLALQDYAHFTSPIRRYPDLIVHRQLKSVLDTTHDGIVTLTKSDLEKKLNSPRVNNLYSFMDLQSIGERTSARERESAEAEGEVLKIRKARFMKGFIHEKFFGVITGINKFGISVELEPYYVDGVLPLSELKDDYYIFDKDRVRLMGRRTRKIFKIGDRVWVEVMEVDLVKAEIILEMVSAKKKIKDVGTAKGSAKKKRRHKQR